MTTKLKRLRTMESDGADAIERKQILHFMKIMKCQVAGIVMESGNKYYYDGKKLSLTVRGNR